MKDSILPADLDRLLDGGANVRVFDVRREIDRMDVEYPIPSAEWRDPEQVAEWSRDIGDIDEVIVYCVHGHHVSQSTRDALCERGIKARIVEGGIEAWCDFGKGKSRTAATRQ
ncbi:MAG: rhodanese-like domain-containing protein [Acidiferrobacterales bacterium]